MILVETMCKLCGQVRKFVQHSPRFKQNICGNCWDWEKFPPQPNDLIGGKV